MIFKVNSMNFSLTLCQEKLKRERERDLFFKSLKKKKKVLWHCWRVLSFLTTREQHPRGHGPLYTKIPNSDLLMCPRQKERERDREKKIDPLVFIILSMSIDILRFSVSLFSLSYRVKQTEVIKHSSTFPYILPVCLCVYINNISIMSLDVRRRIKSPLT